MSVSGFLRASAVILAVFCVVQFNLQAASAYKQPDRLVVLVPLRSDDNIAMAPRRNLGGNLEGRGTIDGAGTVAAKVGGNVEGSVEATPGAESHPSFGYQPGQGLNYNGGVDTYGNVKTNGQATGIAGSAAEGRVGDAEASEGDSENRNIWGRKKGFLFGMFGRSFNGDVMKEDTSYDYDYDTPQVYVGEHNKYKIQPVLTNRGAKLSY